MQLVNDGVVMLDTMKDKKIGPAEVIEKFGVPPDKVIEVQSLIGDSTDNVPGVPGIGVKTAAQLIGEYGDLETLLKRANEIKQEKRRQSLIENADKARLSKKLVTLDDHVKLDVPIGDLAVHEPDHKRLIAFLKAMEFNSLTRRVAEFASIDAGEVEPDAKLAAGGAASPSPAPARVARRAGARRVGLPERRAIPHPAACARPALPPCRGREKAKTAHSPRKRWSTRALGGRAQAEIRSLEIRNRAQPRTAQGLDRARARHGRGRHRHRDHQSRSDAGRSCAVSRSPLRPMRPATSRSRTGRAATAMAVCLPAKWRPIKSPSAPRSRR